MPQPPDETQTIKMPGSGEPLDSVLDRLRQEPMPQPPEDAKPAPRMMCGSIRNLGGLILICDRSYAHPYVWKHRAILDDLTVVEWDGAPSREIPPRLEEPAHVEVWNGVEGRPR